MKKDLHSLKQLFDLVARHKVDSLFPGEWESILKGQGMDFVDLREYQPGDPYKKINWKKTAQDPQGKIYVKQHRAESYASVMLLYDVSKSVMFGEKEDMQAVIAASLAYSALRSNNSCGMIMFSDKVEKYVHPGSGDMQLQYIIKALQETELKACKDTNITEALKRLVERESRSLSFIISDFNAPQDYLNFLNGLDKSKHDVIALIVVAQSELRIPEEGCLIELTDLEKGGSFLLDSKKYYKKYCEEMFKEKQRVKSALEFAGVDAEIITTNDSLVKKINGLLEKRKEKTR